MVKRMLNWLIAVLVIYVAIMLLVMWREKSFIYYPSRDMPAVPAGCEDVWLTTADGVRINGWFIPSGGPIVLFCHGNAGNLSHRSEKLAILRELGASVFIFDYRGYGRSEGLPNERGTYFDAEAAYAYLAPKSKPIFVYGESLGSAIAVELATKHPVAGVILEEPFLSVAAVGRNMFPYLPVGLLVRNKYDTLSKIAGIHAPLLILHSRNDEMFPYAHAERLFAAAREPKQLVELRGSHNDAFLTSAETYRTALRTYLARLTP